MHNKEKNINRVVVIVIVMPSISAIVSSQQEVEFSWHKRGKEQLLLPIMMGAILSLRVQIKKFEFVCWEKVIISTVKPRYCLVK